MDGSFTDNVHPHLLACALQFRKPQRQTPITSIFNRHQALQVQQAVGAYVYLVHFKSILHSIDFLVHWSVHVKPLETHNLSNSIGSPGPEARLI